MSDPKPVRVGLLRIRDHCTFSWQDREGAGRTVLAQATHCPECITELHRQGYSVSREADLSAHVDRTR